MVLKEYETLRLRGNKGDPKADMEPTDDVLLPIAMRLSKSYLINDVLEPLNHMIRSLICVRAAEHARLAICPPNPDTAPGTENDDNLTVPTEPTEPMPPSSPQAAPSATPASPLKRTPSVTLNSGYCKGANLEGKFPTETAPPGPKSWDTMLTHPWIFRTPAGPVPVPNPFHMLAASIPRLPGSPLRYDHRTPGPTNTVGVDFSGLPPVDFHRSYLGDIRTRLQMNYAQPETRAPHPGQETVGSTLPICIPPMHLPPPSYVGPVLQQPQFPMGPQGSAPYPSWAGLQPPAMQMPGSHPSSSQFNGFSSPTQFNGYSSPTRPLSLPAGSSRAAARVLPTGSHGGGAHHRGGNRMTSSLARQPSILDTASHLRSPDGAPTSEPATPLSPLANKTKRKRVYKSRPRKRKSDAVGVTGGDDAEFLPSGTSSTTLGETDGSQNNFTPAPKVAKPRTRRSSGASTTSNSDTTPTQSQPLTRKRRASRLSAVITRTNEDEEIV